VLFLPNAWDGPENPFNSKLQGLFNPPAAHFLLVRQSPDNSYRWILSTR